jgi:hypothetical protein
VEALELVTTNREIGPGKVIDRRQGLGIMRGELRKTASRAASSFFAQAT